MVLKWRVGGSRGSLPPLLPAIPLSLVFGCAAHRHKNPSKVGGFTRPVPPRGMPYFTTLSLVGRSPALPTSVSVAGAKVRRIFVLSKFIVLKKQKRTNILVESCGSLVLYAYLCKRSSEGMYIKRTRAPLILFKA